MSIRALFSSYLLCFLGVSLLSACTQQKEHKVNQAMLDNMEARKANPFNKQAVDSAIGMLRTGDVVLRTGNDITSYMLCQLNTKDKTYSHCGLVLMENGYPFVYHSIGGEANPDARMRRDSASRWFCPADNLGLGIARMDMPESNVDSLQGVVKRMYRAGKKFDLNFDITTDDRFYCAEFVYKAVNRAMGDSLYLKPVTVLGYTFVGVDDIFLSNHAGLICQIRFK